jgi:hypothetical protein
LCTRLPYMPVVPLDKQPTATLKANKTRLAWASGIFQGVTIDGYNMSLNMARKEDTDIPKQLQKLFGGHLNVPPKNPTYLHWYTSGARARGILMTLLFAGYLLPNKRLEVLVALKVNLLRGSTTTTKKWSED